MTSCAGFNASKGGKVPHGRKGLVCALLLLAATAQGDVLCGTWNLKWFPSGRAEHRASPRVEKANIADAADVVREGLRKAGLVTSGKSPIVGETGVILFFQEVRDSGACSKLVTAVGATNLTLASVSAFRDWDNRLLWQQCGIATTLPVVESSWSYWKRSATKLFLPRGYAYAVVDAGKDGLIACFCVHLKSNYGATKPETRAQNAQKREIVAKQMVDLTKKIKTADGRVVGRIIIAGDFNTDPTASRFEQEQTFPVLEQAGFVNCFAGLPLEKRGTHPGGKTYPDITFDYVLHRGFAQADEPVLSPEVPLSDHRMVWLRLR